MPFDFRWVNTSRPLCDDSLTPSSTASGCLHPRSSTPMTTNTHNLLASSRRRLWIPSAHTYTHFRPDHDVLRQSMYSCDPFCFSRDTVVADRPSASGPGKTGNDSCLSPLERPFRYSHDPAASNDRDLRTYGGTSVERNVTAAPVRARTFGILTATGPMPVCTLRAG